MSDRKVGDEAPVKLMWNHLMGDGWICFGTEWMQWDEVSKLDMLQDCICLLQDEYNEILEDAFQDDDNE